MKKLNLLFIGLFLAAATLAQPVVDNAIIPVAVNLNSILRLNVTSGGNIEFTVNTIDQYQDGISNSTRYTTSFTVASSVDFKVELYAEDAQLLGTDNVANEMPLANIGYIMVANAGTAGTHWQLGDASDISPAPLVVLTNSADEIVLSYENNGAGDITKNDFSIQWEMGTPAVGFGSTLLQQSLAPDRYTTNVFLVLSSGSTT